MKKIFIQNLLKIVLPVFSVLYFLVSRANQTDSTNNYERNFELVKNELIELKMKSNATQVISLFTDRGTILFLYKCRKWKGFKIRRKKCGKIRRRKLICVNKRLDFLDDTSALDLFQSEEKITCTRSINIVRQIFFILNDQDETKCGSAMSNCYYGEGNDLFFDIYYKYLLD